MYYEAFGPLCAFAQIVPTNTGSERTTRQQGGDFADENALLRAVFVKTFYWERASLGKKGSDNRVPWQRIDRGR